MFTGIIESLAEITEITQDKPVQTYPSPLTILNGKDTLLNYLINNNKDIK